MKMNCAKFGSVWEEVKHIKSLQMDGGDQKKTHVDLKFRWAKMQRRSGLLVLELHLDKPFKVAKNE